MLLLILLCIVINISPYLLMPSFAETKQYYDALIKASFTPPSYVFSIVWPVIYTMMGGAVYCVYRHYDQNQAAVRWALTLFLVQYGLNLAWGPVFFGRHDFIYGALIVALMWPLILWNIFAFFKIDRLGGLLLVPYFLWVGFAVAISFELLRLNCQPQQAQIVTQAPPQDPTLVVPEQSEIQTPVVQTEDPSAETAPSVPVEETPNPTQN